jgi:hypothetical protein
MRGNYVRSIDGQHLLQLLDSLGDFMKKWYLLILLSINLVSCSISEGTPSPSNPWEYHSKDISIKEKRIFHITEEGFAVYMTGDGEGYGKIITLNPNGKKAWEKDLGTSFAIGTDRPATLYLMEQGKIAKYNLNSGRKISTIKVPVKDINSSELLGISPNKTIYVHDWNTLEIIEYNEKGKKLITLPYSQDAVQNLITQKPNIQNLSWESPENINNRLNTKIIPAFIENSRDFEAKYGKEAKYYPYLKVKEHGSGIYILAYYQINSTIGSQEIFSHSVLFTFSKTGDFISETDLGDYNGTDIDLNTSGDVYVSLNNINSLEPYSIIQVLDKTLTVKKEIKFNNEYITGGKLHNDNLYVVTDKGFYFYPKPKKR